jgi:hypothetical protein
MKRVLNLSTAAVIAVLLILAGCAKTDGSLATLTTSAVTNIQNTSATGGAVISSDGNKTVIARGICWATTHNPTVANFNTAATSVGTGSFTINMTNLTRGTTYYVRAWAANTLGTAYGNEVSFTTTAVCDPGYEGADCLTESRAKFFGTYTCRDTCSSGIYPYTITISGVATDVLKVNITNFGAYGNSISATGTISGNNITIPSQSLSASVVASGSGSLSADGHTLTMQYTSVNGGTSTDACTTIAIK